MSFEEEKDIKKEKPSTTPNPLLSILGNAVQSSMKYEQTKAGLETKTCKSCGAARPEDTNLQFCDYCGYQFY